MDNLCTPWRLPYLRGQEPLPDECLFCIKPQQLDQEAYIVQRSQYCYVILNRFPYNNGHLMIVPYAHLATLEELDVETSHELIYLTKLSLEVLREAYDPNGFNVGANIGSAAGAGIDDHFHLHVVPRWAGDTNFMTSVGQIRVVPESMDQVYQRLRPLFERLGD